MEIPSLLVALHIFMDGYWRPLLKTDADIVALLELLVGKPFPLSIPWFLQWSPVKTTSAWCDSFLHLMQT